MVTRSLFSGLALLVAAHAAPAQEVAGLRTQASAVDSLYDRNAVSFSFDQSFNTYHWNGLGVYRMETGPHFFSLNERFLSNVIRTDRKFITDQQSLDLILKERLATNIRGAMKLSSFIVSDDRSINLTNTSTQALYGGVEYSPMARFIIEPLIGYSFDKQMSTPDRGMSYLLSLSADSIDFDGYFMRLGGRWQYNQLTPRRFETRHAGFFVDKTFVGQTQNSLQFLYDRTRRDIYIPADQSIQDQYNVSHNIESRTENSYGIADALDYTLSNRAVLSIQGSVLTREIGRTLQLKNVATPQQSAPGTVIDELRLESSAQIQYRAWDSLATAVRFEYSERDERHTVDIDEGSLLPSNNSPARIEERKNNHSRRTSIASNIRLGISESHAVSFSSSANLLRYDTPSLENDDDRDELWYFFSLASLHRIDQYLTLRLLADVNLMHVVYIGASRSANNTWNRILRLSPKIEYQPSSVFSTTNSFEVLANYTAYDFEFPSSSIRSFAYRHFSFIDSSSFSVTGKLTLTWFSHIKLYEQGELRWGDFAERPASYFEDKMFLTSLRYTLGRGLHFSVGIRYFSQSRYGYQGSDKHLERFLRSIGPITDLSLGTGKRVSVAVKGWYETQTQTGQPMRSFTNMTMMLVINI